MRAITIHQPYASLIARGEKTVELRSWRTHHRGPLLVHAGLTRRADALRAIDLRTLDMPRGCLLCVVDLLDCVPATREHFRLGWAPDSEPAGFAWVVRRLYSVERKAWQGKQGFMEAPDAQIVRVPTPASESPSGVSEVPSLWNGRTLVQNPAA